MFEPGVSDSLRDLLAIEKKSELERYAKKLIINGAEFVQLTFYSRLIGYRYRARHTEFQPDEAQLTDRDLDATRLNRWKHGSHVHFVNYLWPDYRVEQLDDLLFSGRHTNINSIHIR